MLADNIFECSIAPTVEHFAAQGGGARLILAEVENPEHLRHVGVAELDSSGRIVRIVEKPETPPSNYSVTGVYVYDADVFSILPTLVPSGRGELEITDVNNHYVGSGRMEYDITAGYWGDAGESIEAYYTVNDRVRRHGANKA